MPTLLGIFHRLASAYLNRQLRRVCTPQDNVRFLRSAEISNSRANSQAIEIGRYSVVGGKLLIYPDGGRIRIGQYCFIGPNTSIWAACDIEIGNRVLISHGVNIHDSIAHSLSARERHQHIIEILHKGNGALGNVRKDRIVIEDDAWIGFNATVMKGVRIGRGAVIAAGAVITKDVPPFTIVAGPTAHVIGSSLE